MPGLVVINSCSPSKLISKKKRYDRKNFEIDYVTCMQLREKLNENAKSVSSGPFKFKGTDYYNVEII